MSRKPADSAYSTRTKRKCNIRSKRSPSSRGSHKASNKFDAQSSAAFRALITTANELKAKGQLSMALKCYSAAFVINPNSIDACLGISDVYRRLDETSNTISSLNKLKTLGRLPEQLYIIIWDWFLDHCEFELAADWLKGGLYYHATSIQLLGSIQLTLAKWEHFRKNRLIATEQYSVAKRDLEFFDFVVAHGSADQYLEQNPEVKKAGIGAYAHWFGHGFQQLRPYPGIEYEITQYRGNDGAWRYFCFRGERLRARRSQSSNDPWTMSSHAVPRDSERHDSKDWRNEISIIRIKLLSLGFTEQPLKELNRIALTSRRAPARSLAARELALWHMRDKTEAGYKTALEYIARARVDAGELSERSKLTTLEMLCYYHLHATDAAAACYKQAVFSGEETTDVTLAWLNFQTSPEERLTWINIILDRYGIDRLKLLPDTGLPPYDSLTSEVDLPKIVDGPKVSVLIAAYDAAEVLPTALRCLQEQTWQNLEIIVIDDCSPTLHTVNVAQRYAIADRRIRVLRMQENVGAYVARNRGLDEATGEFVTLHDSDDWSHPRKIETQVRFMLANPDVIGCTTEQVRASSDMLFLRLIANEGMLTQNHSSFMFRRKSIAEKIGYWDTVRVSADSELIRRVGIVFGKNAVKAMQTGPFSFQRLLQTSAVENPIIGTSGHLFGARRIYYDMQTHHHESGKNLRYDRWKPVKHPFPVPAIIRSDRKNAMATTKNFSVIVASDLRMYEDGLECILRDIKALKKARIKTGLFEMFEYDFFSTSSLTARCHADIYSELCGGEINILCFGQTISCDVLIIYGPSVLQFPQRYIPAVKAAQIRVVINRPPMREYDLFSSIRYDIGECAKNIRNQFGKDAIWYPIDPIIRNRLLTHHVEQLKHIKFSKRDWNSAAVIHPLLEEVRK